MAKEKTLFACTACGYETSRWVGRCPGCGAWNTMVESAPIVTGAPAKAPKQRPGTGASAMLLREIPEDVAVRSSTGISELDRVLGGGIVEGALMLIGGDPGIGKSTLLLQVCANLCKTGKRVLYVSGEESAKQLKLRANRLGITSETLYVLAENALDNVEEKLRGLSPDVAVIDSIQTMYRPDMASAPGSVSQIRECTSQIMRLCKESGTAIFLVGHVTKDGAIAGPRMLEHMVDVVLYFEGDRQQEYRLLRAVKNRFGSVNELGVFQMTEAGMQIVPNPSEQLLSHRAKGASGSVVFCGLEGSRPLLCDVQALASTSYFGTPRRTVGGADTGRVALLLAVLEKRANQKTYNQDVYINVAGGLELSEPAADLALCMAVVSSLKDAAIGAEVAVMGEVGLAGEVRAIPQCDRRISECQRLGFTTILLPKERYSYYENRNLSAFPEISVESIANGKVFGELETMFCDYAAWRTAALRAVTWCDLNLFHRPVVNEVVVTPDALLEELYTMPDTAEDIVREADTVAADNAALRDQIEAYGGYYCYLAVPCQYAYYEDAYPAYLENRAAYTAAERAALREAMEARGIAYVDMGEIFDAEGHLPEFSSKVDNHYGLRGAYVTYRAAAERLAADGCALCVPEEGTDVTFSALPNPYMGSRTRKLLGLRGNDEKLLTASFAEDLPFTRFDNGAAAEATVYALPGSDAEPLTYGLYMGGDIAETVIRTDRPELPNALIFGDSFTNPVECLAYYSFNELRSVDLRHYTVQSLSDYIAAYQPDVVLCVRDYQSLLLREFNGDFFS